MLLVGVVGFDDASRQVVRAYDEFVGSPGPRLGIEIAVWLIRRGGLGYSGYA